MPFEIMMLNAESEDISQLTLWASLLTGVILVHKMTCVFVGSPLATL